MWLSFSIRIVELCFPTFGFHGDFPPVVLSNRSENRHAICNLLSNMSNLSIKLPLRIEKDGSTKTTEVCAKLYFDINCCFVTRYLFDLFEEGPLVPGNACCCHKTDFFFDSTTIKRPTEAEKKTRQLCYFFESP